MPKRKFNKEASLEAGEVMLDIIVEDSEVSNVMETPFQSEPTAEELKACKQLTGTPCTVDSSLTAIMESATRKGIAASFGADGYARGHKFFQYFK